MQVVGDFTTGAAKVHPDSWWGSMSGSIQLKSEQVRFTSQFDITRTYWTLICSISTIVFVLFYFCRFDHQLTESAREGQPSGRVLEEVPA
jgi:hypothetical protein